MPDPIQEYKDAAKAHTETVLALNEANREMCEARSKRAREKAIKKREQAVKNEIAVRKAWDDAYGAAKAAAKTCKIPR